MSLSCRTTSPLLVTIMMPSPFLNEELPLGISILPPCVIQTTRTFLRIFISLRASPAMLCLLVNSEFYSLRLTVRDKVNGDCRTALIFVWL